MVVTHTIRLHERRLNGREKDGRPHYRSSWCDRRRAPASSATVPAIRCMSSRRGSSVARSDQGFIAILRLEDRSDRTRSTGRRIMQNGPENRVVALARQAHTTSLLAFGSAVIA